MGTRRKVRWASKTAPIISRILNENFEKGTYGKYHCFAPAEGKKNGFSVSCIGCSNIIMVLWVTDDKTEKLEKTIEMYNYLKERGYNCSISKHDIRITCEKF